METLGLPSHNNPIKLQLTILSFLQYFVWGAWLITVGKYCTITMVLHGIWCHFYDHGAFLDFHAKSYGYCG